MTASPHIKPKDLEIFCGTGGVGKTTLATSRAISLAAQGKKVLLITIDPAKRLKQVLHLNEKDAGTIEKIKSESLPIPGSYTGPTFELDALLLDPKKTLLRVLNKERSGDSLNSILNILAKPHGGLNEIMAVMEVQYHFKSKVYDAIVLDTPPGKHFVDFLHSARKINKFFDKSFVEIFKFLGKPFGKVDKKSLPGKFFSSMINTGIKKLLGYLEKVTGKTFVDEFIETVGILYSNRETFINALSINNILKDQEFSNWYLVTSVDQQKLSETSSLESHAREMMHNDKFLLINKSLKEHLEGWEVPYGPKSIDHMALDLLKDTMLTKENRIREFAERNELEELSFPEVLTSGPLEQALLLSTEWPRPENDPS